MKKRSKTTILIADDEKDIRYILTDVLSGAGYQVTAASDGKEAREKVLRDHPDMVILDIRLPVVDGLTLLEEFQSKTPETAIIIMTAHGSEATAIRALKSGAEDYLPKPFDPDELVVVVQRVLHHREVEQQRAQLAKEIEIEKRRLEATMVHMVSGLVTTNPAGKVIFCNQKASDILGLKQDKIVGSHIGELFPTFLPGSKTSQASLLEQNKSFSLETKIQRPDESIIPLLIDAGPIEESGCARCDWVIVFQDLSAVKALELEKEEFVSMVAHDLRSPLTSIFATFELFLDGSLGQLTKKQQEYLTIAHSGSIKMGKMIDSFLEIYRMEAGKIPLTAELLDPEEFIAPIVQRFLPVAEERKISLTLKLSDGLPKIEGDREHLMRVVDNLLSNAFKFTPEGGKVTVSAEPKPADPDHAIQVTVRDTGPGIPLSDLPYIFKKFGQARRRKIPRSGIGLGLAYCRLAVERHGGTISVDSVEGKGSSFTFTLPTRLPDSSSSS